MRNALLATTAGTPIEVWFQDEARVGQKGSLTYVWAPIGSCPGWYAIIDMIRLIYSERFAQPVPSAPPSSCLLPMPRR